MSQCEHCSEECQEIQYQELMKEEIQMDAKAKEMVRHAIYEVTVAILNEARVNVVDVDFDSKVRQIMPQLDIRLYHCQGQGFDGVLKVTILHHLLDSGCMVDIKPDHWWYRMPGGKWQ